jgi:hypothetical protein
VRVQPQPATRDAPVQLGQEQRQLLELLGRQGAGELRQVPLQDAAPDADGVELRMPLRTGLLLLLQVLEIQVPDLMPIQVRTPSP